MIKPQFLKLQSLKPLILILVSCAFLADAEVYKIVDSQGRVTYTDTPPTDESADQLELPPINELPGTYTADTEVLSSDSSVFAGYSVIEIAAPLNESLIYYDQQNIIVQLALVPELQVGHLVQFYLDGTAYGRPMAATSYAIGSLQRGSHSISARVVTAEGGNAIANSESVKVYVQRHFKRN
jgi:hypothetical protein